MLPPHRYRQVESKVFGRLPFHLSLWLALDTLWLIHHQFSCFVFKHFTVLIENKGLLDGVILDVDMPFVVRAKNLLPLDHQCLLLRILIQPFLIQIVNDGLVVFNLFKSSQVKLNLLHLAILAKNDIAASPSVMGGLSS